MDGSETFLLFVLVGFLAQLVDGALGMAYGLVSSTVLLSLGVPPATASAAVHAAEVVTTGISGASHAYHRNVDKRLFLSLAIPGAVGGAAGAYFLANIPGERIKPYVLAYLLVLGVVVLVRAFGKLPQREVRHAGVLGFIGGLLDAAGGGGWGPIVTSNLLIQGADPRKVVGTVNSVEFFLTLTVSAAFIYHLGIADLAGATLGLLIGGILAAPLGAWAAKHLPAKKMLILVGIVLTLTSAYGVWNALK